MKRVPFVKATACGNDFLLIESKDVEGNKSEFARRICDRHFGVGADGVEWMSSEQGDDADVVIHLTNADGSPAEISGNGTRCVAAYWMWERASRPKSAAANRVSVTIRTDAGLKVCNLQKSDGNEFEFETDMGAGTVSEELLIELDSGAVRGVPVSTGNPHFVMFVEKFAANWQAQAAALGVHPHFPEGTNVELVRVVGPVEIEIRVYERGAGETQSSGTGSCASAVAAIATGRARSPLRVVSPGGPQTVRWENGTIFLRGPATLICRGEYLWKA